MVTPSIRKMKEYEIEHWSKQKARQLGWWVRKFTTPARRAAPDDIFAKNGRVFWVEFKASDGVVTELQRIEHEEMRKQGLTVYVCNSREEFTAIIEAEEFALEMTQ